LVVFCIEEGYWIYVIVAGMYIEKGGGPDDTETSAA